MLDQGFFSAATFLINILLARWLLPREYGAVAMALSVYYLLLNFHTAVLTEPMLVFGTGKYWPIFRKYAGVLFYVHWALSAVIALLLGTTALIAHSVGAETMAQAFAGLALASPLLLLLGFARRTSYVPIRPLWATVGSVVNLFIVLGGAVLLWRVGVLSALSGLVLMGVAAGLASLVVLFRVRPRLSHFGGMPPLASVWADHRHYGTWSFLGVLANWTSGTLLLLLVPLLLGLVANATVAAVWNLYRPIGLLIQATSLVLLPTFTRWASRDMRPSEFRRRVIWVAIIMGTGVILYDFVVTVNSSVITGLLYNGRYNDTALVVLAGIPRVAAVAIVVVTCALKARGGVRQASFVWVISAVIVLATGVWVVGSWGADGALGLFSLSYFIALILAFVFLQRTLRRAQGSPR